MSFYHRSIEDRVVTTDILLVTWLTPDLLVVTVARIELWIDWSLLTGGPEIIMMYRLLYENVSVVRSFLVESLNLLLFRVYLYVRSLILESIWIFLDPCVVALLPGRNIYL